MFKHIAIAVITTSGLLLSAQVSAHQSESEIDKQQKEQAVMIKQGIKTCQLTKKEAKTLNATQDSIAALEKKYRKNGLQTSELKTLTSKLHDARVQINKLTKNSTTCRPSAETPRDRQEGVIKRTDPSRIPRTTDGRGTENVVIGR